MAIYISKKSSRLRGLASFILAAGTAALLTFLLNGPRLGPFYDFLLRQRPAPPVSGELLIIDSSVPGLELGEDILEPGAATSLLYTMTELGAQTLIIQVPILGLSIGGTVGEEEISYRFDEEFSLLSRNIRNLFDGIRTGSVAPADSARYVGELVELSEKGKERLVSALLRRDEEGMVSMEKAAAFFGNVRRPGDLRVQLIRELPRAGESDSSALPAEGDGYSRARPDRDGFLRRIAPILAIPELSGAEAGERKLEHIIYGALKTRYSTLEIEDSPELDLLSIGMERSRVLAARNGPDGTDRFIPLDRNDAVLFEPPHNGGDFRRISISDFLAYEEADRALRRLLMEGEALGIYQGIEGEHQPPLLYDYALSLRDEGMKHAWIESRDRYFKSLEDFLYGPTEMNLVGVYEEIIASEFRDSNFLDETGESKMLGMRDTLIRSFVALRAQYNDVMELRDKLKSALSDSICILGRGSANSALAGESMPSLFRDFPGTVRYVIRSFFYKANPTDAEASALLANSILTGRAVKPGRERLLFLLSLLCASLVCLLVKSRGPVPALGIGTFLTVLSAAGFSWSFMLSGLWLDPLVPAAACAAGVLVSFIWAMIAKSRYSRLFRLAYGPAVSRSCLRSVIREGNPLPSGTITARAAVVAVKNPELGGAANSPHSNAQAVLLFQEKASGIFRKAGGTIIGTEGDMVIACFGSPLERVFLGGKRRVSPYEDNINALAAPAMRAADFVSEIARRPECAPWHFGIDLGNCSFSWTALSGYFALGIPVQKAKILSRLGGRYRERIIISETVNEALPDQVLKKLGAIKGSNGQVDEPFYRLSTGS